MFKLIIETAVRHRWLVVFMAALLAAPGARLRQRVPDGPELTRRA